MKENFFKEKRKWSRYKDFLLQQYLEKYIPTVSFNPGKPIKIVDCCAGRGFFDDGSDGSPIIISRLIKSFREGKQIDVSGVFIEANQQYCNELKAAVTELDPHATVIHSRFGDKIDYLAELASNNSLFLYVDPFAVRGLEMSGLAKVYNQLTKGSSVEVLMNFNAPIFMRWALAALGRMNEIPPDHEFEFFGDSPNDSPEKQILTDIAGDEYWIEIAKSSQLSFEKKVSILIEKYTQRLRSKHFNSVHYHAIKERYEHQTPKYFMVFGTRSPKAMLLMNEFAATARQEFLKAEFVQNRLMDITPESEKLPVEKIKISILDIASSNPLSRASLHFTLIEQGFFGRISKKQITQIIDQMLREQTLFLDNGKTKSNDTAKISTRAFQ